MARRIVGLDVGTFSVKVTHLESRGTDAEFDLLAYGEVPLSKFVKEGEVKSEQDLQLEALKELGEAGLVDGSWVVTGLPGSDAQIRSLEVPFSNRKKIEAVLGGLMDSHLPFPVDNLVYTWFPIAEEPKGSNLLVGFAKKETIANALAHLRKAQVDPRYLTLKAAALYDLLITVAPKDSGPEALYGVVDIGHKSTGICIGDKKNLRFSRSVPRGGFDVTQGLAQKAGLSFNDAEKQKLSAAGLTEAVRESYYPIAREVRQTILGLESETHQKLEHIYLVGGASKAAGLVEFLSSLLALPVTLLNDFSQFSPTPSSIAKIATVPKAEAGLALSYAAMGERAAKREPRFNFRKDEFAFSGELDYMRQRTKTIAVWGCVALLLFALSSSFGNFVRSRQIENLNEQQRQTCKAITGLERDGENCLTQMRSVMAGSTVPKYSASDVYLELSKTIPQTVQIKKIRDFDVSSDLKVRFVVEAFSFDTEEIILKLLRESQCFRNVEKSDAKKTSDGSRFAISMIFDCRVSKGATTPGALASKEN